MYRRYIEDRIFAREVQRARRLKSYAVTLRRLAAVPELAYLAPFFHAMHAGASRLQLDDGSALFEGVEGRVGDSSTGVRQGSAESAPVFCVAIHPEVSELHATLSSVGGCASADMDDVPLFVRTLT